MEGILTTNALTKRYSGIAAVDNITLSLPTGRVVGLLGPNGSGKTTLIKLAAGLLTPSSGDVRIDGKAIGVETKAVVSYLPEKSYLADWMRVDQCLGYFEDFYADFDRKRAENMLKRLDVSPNARIKTLSKGTQEKVHLVLVISRRAKLYLLDEPISGVDPATRDYILNTIIGNYDEGATVLISTHLIHDVEKILDEFIFLKEGRVVMRDCTDNIRETEGRSLDELFREVFRC